MFNWICPECGRDVSPSATECPYCADRKKTAAAAPVVEAPPAYSAAPPPPAPVYNPPPQGYQPPPQHPAHQHYPPPPQQPPYYQPQYPVPKAGLPTWLLSVLFALAFLGLIAGIYFAYQYFGKGPRAERAGVTEPAAAARNKPANPLQKYIEVVGIRLVQDAKHHPEARFVVVNHSNTELNDINANVTLYASTSRSEEDSVGTFSFKLGSIGANESKEIAAPLNTKLKAYELPDWQNATADVQITAP